MGSWLAAQGLAGSTAGADFVRGIYWLPNPVSGLPTRASQAEWFASFMAAGTSSRTYWDASGKLRSNLAANQPRFSWESGRRRLVLEDALTNKLECRKHNPVDAGKIAVGAPPAGATYGVADRPDEIAAMGLDPICTNGKVYFADNPSGSGAPFFIYPVGLTGNVNPHTLDLFGWSTGAGTKPTLRLESGGTGAKIIESSPGRVTCPGLTPGSSSDRIVIIVWPGTTVFFILPGLYEQAFAPHAPIPGDALAAVTRPIESFQILPAIVSMLAGGATALVRGKLTTPAPNARVLGGRSSVALISRGPSDANITAYNQVVALRADSDDGGFSSDFGAVFAGSNAPSRKVCLNGSAIAEDANETGVTDGVVYLGRCAALSAPVGSGFYDQTAWFPEIADNARIQSLAVPYAA
ncbi:hypothetical protein NVS89_22420 [Ancylobacter sp. MQZ15Z-1]|uniref:Uncharacterized protein n=1 Tax=Ancylobacter mangrovi TaxID=2972472 RepID=A0A9X2PFR0_9HYPH|nr:hypothetical protein [Ancylobacter mangrovi]MCS0497849.1 hypothetical protein [Ancylobacter mangrovi]